MMKPSDITVGKYYCTNDGWDQDETNHPIIRNLLRTGWWKRKTGQGSVMLIVHPTDVYAVSLNDPDWKDCPIASDADHWENYQSTFYADGVIESYLAYDIYGLTKPLADFYDGIHILHYKCYAKQEYRKGLMTIKTGNVRGHDTGISWCPKQKRFVGLGRYGYLVDLEELENNHKEFGVKDALKVLNRRLKHQKDEQMVVDNPYHGY